MYLTALQPCLVNTAFLVEAEAAKLFYPVKSLALGMLFSIRHDCIFELYSFLPLFLSDRGSAELGSVELGTDEVGFPEVGFPEVGIAEIGYAEVIRIGRALRPFPPSKRSMRLSPHCAFQYSD